MYNRSVKKKTFVDHLSRYRTTTIDMLRMEKQKSYSTAVPSGSDKIRWFSKGIEKSTDAVAV